MESFIKFKSRKTRENPELTRSSNTFLRKLYHEEYGVWPGEETSGETAKRIVSGNNVQITNTHSTLDAISAFISFTGWVVVGLGSIAAIAGFISLGDRDGLGIIGIAAGLVSVIMGLLVIANGQFLKVIGQVEKNTQKSAILLEHFVTQETFEDS